MRRGVRLALDLGSVRTGVARCDASGTLASPVAVWKLDSTDLVASALKELLAHEEVLEVIVGLPTDLRGVQSVAAASVRERVTHLKALLPDVTFRLVDERMTSAAARKQLQNSGYTTRTDRDLIDPAAATVLLQDALEAEVRQGHAPGEVV